MASRLRTAGLDSVTGQHKFFQGTSLDTIMGASTPTTIEVNLGSAPHHSGHFDITGLANLNISRTVVISQAPGPYTGKGTLPDEAEMDQAVVTGYILNTTTIRCYWVSAGPMKNNIKFIYQVVTSQ